MDRRTLLAPAAVAAVVVTALAVGDHSGTDSPAGAAAGATDATPSTRIVTDAEFCAGFDVLAAAQEALFTAATPDSLADLKEAATTVGDLATGVALTDQQRAGVTYVVAAFLGLPDDATAQDVVESDDAATLADDAHAQALAAYLGDACRSDGTSQAY